MNLKLIMQKILRYGFFLGIFLVIPGLNRLEANNAQAITVERSIIGHQGSDAMPIRVSFVPAPLFFGSFRFDLDAKLPNAMWLCFAPQYNHRQGAFTGGQIQISLKKYLAGSSGVYFSSGILGGYNQIQSSLYLSPKQKIMYQTNACQFGGLMQIGFLTEPIWEHVYMDFYVNMGYKFSMNKYPNYSYPLPLDSSIKMGNKNYSGAFLELGFRLSVDL